MPSDDASSASLSDLAILGALSLADKGAWAGMLSRFLLGMAFGTRDPHWEDRAAEAYRGGIGRRMALRAGSVSQEALIGWAERWIEDPDRRDPRWIAELIETGRIFAPGERMARLCRECSLAIGEPNPNAVDFGEPWDRERIASARSALAAASSRASSRAEARPRLGR